MRVNSLAWRSVEFLITENDTLYALGGRLAKGRTHIRNADLTNTNAGDY